MPVALWYFWIYSFLGFLLERAFAAATHAPRQGRRCFLLLPLCPVYGLGMLAVLALPPAWQEGPWLILSGGLAATAVEYGVHWAYERFLGVRLWDYAQVRGNLRGRVCLPFTVAWGVLTAISVWWIQPGVEALAGAVPAGVTYGCLLLFSADTLLSARFLWVTHDIDALRSFS